MTDRFLVEEGDFPPLPFWPGPTRTFATRIIIPQSRFKAMQLGRYEDFSNGSVLTSWLHETFEHGHWAIAHKDISQPTERVFVYFIHSADAAHFMLRWADV